MLSHTQTFFFFHLQLKLSECESNGINHSNDNLISSTDMLATKCHDTVANKINHSGTANGSLITMTMKNNHLIVETEERSVSKLNSVQFQKMKKSGPLRPANVFALIQSILRMNS